MITIIVKNNFTVVGFPPGTLEIGSNCGKIPDHHQRQRWSLNGTEGIVLCTYTDKEYLSPLWNLSSLWRRIKELQ